MIARWPDGFCATLPELLQGQWRAAKRLQARKTTNTTTVVLAAPRRSNGKIVKVAYRSELPGQENYRIMEDGHTIAIVQLNKFKGDDVAAREFAISLATEMIHEDITKGEVIRRRDQRMPKQERSKKKKHKVAAKEQMEDDEAQPEATTTATTTCTTPPAQLARSPSVDPDALVQTKRRRAHDMSSIPRGLMSSSDEWSPRTP